MQNDTNEQAKVKINFMILREQVFINYDSRNFTVNKGSDEYEHVLHILKNYQHADPASRTQLEDIIPIIDPQRTLSEAVPNGEFVIQKGKIYSNGELVSGYVSQKLLEFLEQGLPYMPLFNFWKRLKGNPSENSKEQLYRFLEFNHVPLTEEGKFIAYKSVRKDMKDHYSGRFQYKLNVPAEMDRSQVVDDCNHACGPGLHIGAFTYAKNFGSDGLLLECEVDPADVVSVPKDFSSQKIRACRFIPVAICQEQYTSPIIITKNERTSRQPATQPATQRTTSSLMIGRDAYSHTVIDEAVFNSITAALYREVVDIRPSKASVSMKSFITTYGDMVSCKRFLDENTKCYVAKYKKDETVTYILFTPEGFGFVSKVAQSGTIDDFKQPIKVKERVLEYSVVFEFVLPQGSYANVRTLSRSKYPVALTQNPSSSKILRVLRGTHKENPSVPVFLVDVGVPDTFILYGALV